MLALPVLVLTTLWLGYGVSRQFFGAQRVWEALSLAPLVACLVVLGGATAWGPVEGRWPTAVVSGLFALLLTWLPSPPVVAVDTDSDAEPHPTFGLRWLWSAMVLVVPLSVLAVVLEKPALDGWFQEPLIAAYALGLSPSTHPLLSELEVGREHGGALLLGALLPQGADPLLALRCLAPVLALSALLVLTAIARRWGETALALALAPLLLFFASGEQGGLLYEFASVRGLSYALLVLFFYVVLRLLELLPTSRPGHLFGLWCGAGYLLGVYRTVDNALFWLLVGTTLLLLPLALLRAVSRGRLLAGVTVMLGVALLLAGCCQGFEFAGLPALARAPSVTFSWWGRQGVAVVLAPLTLLWLLRQRHLPGLALALSGMLAFVLLETPHSAFAGSESLSRWVGPALAVPLGFLAVTLLGNARAGWRRWLARLGGVLILLLLVAPSMSRHAALVERLSTYTSSQLIRLDEWRLAQPELGLSEADQRCVEALAGQVLPGETLLSCLRPDPTALRRDAAFCAQSGARVLGHVLLEPSVGHAYPSTRQHHLSIALAASGRPDLLWNSGVSWLLLDPALGELALELERSPHALRVHRAEQPDGELRELWKLTPPPSLAVARLPSQPPFRSRTLLLTSDGPRSWNRLEEPSWQPEASYRLQIAALNAQETAARLGWLRIVVQGAGGEMAGEPLQYLLGANPLPSGRGDLHEVVFVTPRQSGSYTVIGELLTGQPVQEPLFSLPLVLP